jgi:membrane protein implicated in regulation of membrane protease activity
MAWWTWVVIGILLLGAELFFVEVEFYLVFIGLAAILSGLLALNAPDLPQWILWIAFAGLSITSMVLFRRRVYSALRPQVGDRKDDLVDDRIRVPADLAPNAEIRLEHRGTTWNARNVGGVSIEADAEARIVGVDGITLRIQGEQPGRLAIDDRNGG